MKHFFLCGLRKPRFWKECKERVEGIDGAARSFHEMRIAVNWERPCILAYMTGYKTLTRVLMMLKTSGLKGRGDEIFSVGTRS